jgi:hypothetical protein
MIGEDVRPMETNRRDMLILACAFAALGERGASAAPAAPPPGLMEVLHVYRGADGLSRAQKVRVYGSKPIPVVQVVAGAIGAGDTDWGTAKQKRFSINTEGELDVELGDGTRHHIGKGDLVFIEDQGSPGHRSHMITPVANLFLIVADDFDLRKWAGEPAAEAGGQLK